MQWFTFILGLLIGWLVEWLIDIFYWRRRYGTCMESRAQLDAELGNLRAGLRSAQSASAQVDRLQADLVAARAQVSALEAEVARLRERSGSAGTGLLTSSTLGDVTAPSRFHEGEQGAGHMSAAVRAAVPTPPDNLEIIEGIGPAIARVLNEQGIATFLALSGTSPAALNAVLDAAGPRFRMADPTSWPEQARLAAEESWEALKVMQDNLRAGRQ